MQNAALDFSKLQEAMGDGQCLSVSARAKLLESPFVQAPLQAEPTPSSVQKLAKIYANVGIAPPKPHVQKALQFGTPSKGMEASEPRTVLGELPNNQQSKAIDDHSVALCVDASNKIVEVVCKDALGEKNTVDVNRAGDEAVIPIASHAEDNCARGTLEDEKTSDAVCAGDKIVVDSPSTAHVEENCTELMGDLAAALERVDVTENGPNVCEQPDVGAPRLLGHNFDAYVPDFDDDEDAKSVTATTEEKGLEDIEISLLTDDHPASDELRSEEKDATAKDHERQGKVVEEQASDELCNTEQGGADDEPAVEPQVHHTDEISCADSCSLAQPGEGIDGVQAPEQENLIEQSDMNSSVQTAEEMSVADIGSLAQPGEGIEGVQAPEQEQAIEQSDMNSTVETAPDCLVNEIERYDAALDNTAAFEPVNDVMQQIASTEDAQQPETALELGAYARSQVVTGPEMLIKQQGKVFLEVTDKTVVDDIDTHAALEHAADEIIREASSVPVDPQEQASETVHGPSLLAVPNRSNSSPVEEHLKQVVQTSLDLCSEAKEENLYLSEKVDMLEKHEEISAVIEKELAVDDIEKHTVSDHAPAVFIRQASPVPVDHLEQASETRHSPSLVSVPNRRNSSPMEEHLKQVVKTSVVNFCSEVQEENQYLSEKVDMLEKQVEKFAMLEKELADTQKQLDRTTSQLNDCATKQQMMELLSQHAVMQELLREQLALREQGKASCRGCTIC